MLPFPYHHSLQFFHDDRSKLLEQLRKQQMKMMSNFFKWIFFSPISTLFNQSVDAIQTRTKTEKYANNISKVYDSDAQITGDSVTFSKDGTFERKIGKVRDRYDLPTKLALVTTDRQSGFDRMLAKVPFKGQVLNLTSAYWFEQTKDIIPNHIISIPHPNISIVKKCTPFPIEFVVR